MNDSKILLWSISLIKISLGEINQILSINLIKAIVVCSFIITKYPNTSAAVSRTSSDTVSPSMHLLQLYVFSEKKKIYRIISHAFKILAAS